MEALDRHFMKLFSDVWRDLRDPAMLWEIGARVACLAIAWWLQWRVRQHRSVRGGLLQAGEAGLRRIVFPLSALLLVLVTRELVRPFMPVALLNLAVPLLLSLALVRAVVFSLRYAFPAARWLKAWERYVAATIWLCLVLYITGLADPVIAGLESVKFTIGKQRLDR